MIYGMSRLGLTTGFEMMDWRSLFRYWSREIDFILDYILARYGRGRQHIHAYLDKGPHE